MRFLTSLAAVIAVFSIALAKADEKRELADISITIENPGAFIGEGYSKGEKMEKEDHSMSFANVSVLRDGESLIVNETKYDGIPLKSEVTVTAKREVIVGEKKLKGTLIDIKFREEEWDVDQQELDGVTLDVSGFKVGSFSSTYDDKPERKAGARTSMEFGMMSVTLDRGHVYLWNKLLGTAEKTVSIDQKTRKIMIDGKEVKWPE
jgi:hypothetical protein